MFNPSKLRQLRKARGYTQEDVARSTGIGRGNYAKKETGQVVVTLDDLDRLAECYGMDVVEFFGGQPGGTGDSVSEMTDTIMELSKLIAKLNRRIEELEKELDEAASPAPRLAPRRQ